MVQVDILVEGLVDEAVVKRIFEHMGIVAGEETYGKKGKQHLLKQLAKYNNAARFLPWFALLDLDNDYSCVRQALKEWLPDRADRMCFRIAVQEIEAWLLADREKYQNF